LTTFASFEALTFLFRPLTLSKKILSFSGEQQFLVTLTKQLEEAACRAHLVNVGGEGGADGGGSHEEIFLRRWATMEGSTLFENFETVGSGAGSRPRVDDVDDTSVRSGCRRRRLPSSRDCEEVCKDAVGQDGEGKDRDVGDGVAADVGLVAAGRRFQMSAAKKMNPAAED